MLVAKQHKEERINVRVPEELKRALEESASESGWGVSDQIRFELLYLRGLVERAETPDSARWPG